MMVDRRESGGFRRNQRKSTIVLDPDLRPLFAETLSFEDAQARLEAAGLGDGLPLVVPTARRLAAMLAGVARPEESRGSLPPLFGELMPEDVAYQCVLAGCRPGVVPLVLTAATACLEDDFNLLGLMTTTGSAAVAVVVHGPIVASLGLNAGTNCLGPGTSANATIGRALSLVLRNIGGAREGVGDMATLGQPGKYTFCFAEHAGGPLPSLAARRGLDRACSAVTVLGVAGTAEVLPDEPRDTPQTILDPLARIMAAANSTTGAARKGTLPEQVFLLPPELVDLVVAAGWDVAAIQRTLHEKGVSAEPGDVHPIVTGGAGIKMAVLTLWGGGSRTVTRAIEG